MEFRTLSQAGLDYIVTWDYLTLRFSKLKEHSDGHLAYLVIEAQNLPGHSSGEVFEGNIQLRGSRSKADIVKECERRFTDLDWTSIITRSCREVLKALEEGDPIINLGEGDVQEDAAYLMFPLIRDREHGMLYGPGGTGKSTLALAIATALDQGLPYGEMKIEQPQKVLYLDYEDDESNQRRRLQALCNGWGLYNRADVLYKSARASLPALADSLARQIAREKIDGAIIDSAALAAGGEPEKAEQALDYFRALRSLGLHWSLTIGHQPKEKSNDPMPFGSIYWWNSMRSVWHTRLSQEAGADEIHVGLWHRKANNTRLQRPFGYSIHYAADSTVVAVEDLRTIEEFVQHLSQKEQVRIALTAAHKNSQGLNVAELVNETGISEKSLRVVLGRLRKESKIALVSDRYWLTPTA